MLFIVLALMVIFDFISYRSVKIKSVHVTPLERPDNI
jgi:hypothetical protein